MKNQYIDKKIGIFGLGKTGKSIYKFLNNYSDNIICWDDSKEQRDNFIAPHIEANLIKINNDMWNKLDMIAISPGVPYNHPIFSLIKRCNILILSDISLFIESNPKSKIISITGTNGKSTCASLTHHIIKKHGLDFYLGGNIGKAVLDLPQNKDGYVLELSSFQLGLLEKFNPEISVLLNITPDHIEAHGGFEQYCKAKYNAFKGNGTKIIGTNTTKSAELYSKLNAFKTPKTIEIGNKLSKHSIYIINDKLFDNYYDNKFYKLPELPNLQGIHNAQNIAASYSACRTLGISGESFIKHLASFSPLPHRMQYLGSKQKVNYYNDSKATNTDSCAQALSSFKNIFWIAGGVFKEENLCALNDCIKNVEKAYLFGKDKEVFAKYLNNKVKYDILDTLDQAFDKARDDANNSAILANIIFSPACASFDQYKNFEERGNQFIKLYEKK